MSVLPTYHYKYTLNYKINVDANTEEAAKIAAQSEIEAIEEVMKLLGCNIKEDSGKEWLPVSYSELKLIGKDGWLHELDPQTKKDLFMGGMANTLVKPSSFQPGDIVCGPDDEPIGFAFNGLNVVGIDNKP